MVYLDSESMSQVLEDAEASKKLGEEVRERMLQKLPNIADPLKELQVLFNQISSEGGQSLKRKEFQMLLNSLDIHFSRKKWALIFKEVDHNFDDEISLEELLLFIFPDHDVAKKAEKKRMKIIAARVKNMNKVMVQHGLKKPMEGVSVPMTTAATEQEILRKMRRTSIMSSGKASGPNTSGGPNTSTGSKNASNDLASAVAQLAVLPTIAHNDNENDDSSKSSASSSDREDKKPGPVIVSARSITSFKGNVASGRSSDGENSARISHHSNSNNNSVTKAAMKDPPGLLVCSDRNSFNNGNVSGKFSGPNTPSHSNPKPGSKNSNNGGFSAPTTPLVSRPGSRNLSTDHKASFSDKDENQDNKSDGSHHSRRNSSTATPLRSTPPPVDKDSARASPVEGIATIGKISSSKVAPVVPVVSRNNSNNSINRNNSGGNSASSDAAASSQRCDDPHPNPAVRALCSLDEVSPRNDDAKLVAVVGAESADLTSTAVTAPTPMHANTQVAFTPSSSASERLFQANNFLSGSIDGSLSMSLDSLHGSAPELVAQSTLDSSSSFYASAAMSTSSLRGMLDEFKNEAVANNEQVKTWMAAMEAKLEQQNQAILESIHRRHKSREGHSGDRDRSRSREEKHRRRKHEPPDGPYDGTTNASGDPANDDAEGAAGAGHNGNRKYVPKNSSDYVLLEC
jgi:hypothetical protein